MNLFRSRRARFLCLSALVIAAAACLYSCDDKGLDPNYFPTIRGHLDIQSPPPEETDEIVLALVQGLSPKFTRTVPRATLNMTAQQQIVDFVMEARTGEYDALFAIWKKRGQPLSVFENIVGSYCLDDSLIQVILTEENSLLDSVEVGINLRKVNRTARVAGAINFAGNWPTDIDQLGIVFAEESAVLEFLFNPSVCNLLKNLDIRLITQRNVSTIEFEHDVAPGRTVMILAWNRRGEPIFRPRLITQIPFAAVDAVPDSTIRGIQINAQF